MKKEKDFLKEINKVVKEAKIEQSPYREQRHKTILIELIETDWDIFENILNTIIGLEKGIATELQSNYAKTVEIESQVVPKYKIKKLIEELANKIDDNNYWKTTETQWIQYNYGIKILQELLEE